MGLTFAAIYAFSLPGTPRVVPKKCSIMSKVGVGKDSSRQSEHDMPN